MGYGIDGKVYLRWAEAETKQERSILSGYHIERKLDGESSFTRITDEPVAISHVLDETNTYFQSPVFYEDTVDNGAQPNTAFIQLMYLAARAGIRMSTVFKSKR